MKITKIDYQRDKSRVNIYIDDKFAFGISDELRFKHNLKIDDEINDEFIQNILLAEEQSKAINYALNLLSYRQRSEKEIQDALRRKGYEDIFIEKAIDYCKDNKYIDDLSFAKSYIKDKVSLSKYGSKRIKYELQNKGISREIISRTLKIDDDVEYESALNLASKRLGNYKDDDYNSTYRKLSGYLQRRGYPFDVISKVLRQLLKEEW